MADFDELTERELRLTAALYVKHQAHKHLQVTGRLPDKVGGMWSCIPLRHLLEQRGTDLTLTPDEQLVYDALVRERRLPGRRRAAGGRARCPGCQSQADPVPSSQAGETQGVDQENRPRREGQSA